MRGPNEWGKGSELISGVEGFAADLDGDGVKGCMVGFMILVERSIKEKRRVVCVCFRIGEKHQVNFSVFLSVCVC